MVNPIIRRNGCLKEIRMTSLQQIYLNNNGVNTEIESQFFIIKSPWGENKSQINRSFLQDEPKQTYTILTYYRDFLSLIKS